MELLIFKTNIKTRKNAKTIKSLFEYQSSIINWSIDLEDIDKVLKVSIAETLTENDIKNFIKAKGFHCEALPD